MTHGILMGTHHTIYPPYPYTLTPTWTTGGWSMTHGILMGTN